MRRQFMFWTVAAALVVSCLTGCVSAQETQTIAKDFTLKGLDDSSFTLSEFRDKKPVLIFFWTTWCPFCRKELTLLKDKYDQIVKDGIELAIINVQESSAKVQDFAKRNNISFRILLDSSAEVAQAYQIYGIPTYVLVDKKGVIRFEDNSFPSREYKRLISE